MTKTLKILLIILGAVILAAIAVLVPRLFTKEGPPPPQLPKGATLYLSPETRDLKPGDKFTVDVLLDTGDQIWGAAAVSAFLSFDNNLLELLSIDASSSDFNKEIKMNEENGLVEISRINFTPNSLDVKPVKGKKLVLAKLNFQAKKPGEAKVSFLLSGDQKSAVLMFNKAEPSKSGDILKQTKNGLYIIR
jgi:hypothetical protein